MSRKKRQESPVGVYHWICRGIHKKDLFHHPADFEFFKKLLIEYKTSYNIRVFHYCFMTNHVHLLIYSFTLDDMAKFSQFVQRRYAYYYCGSYRWVGNVFQRGYKSLPVDKDAYLLECGRYIERNPIRAGVTKHPADYPYSSYGFYAHGKSDNLLEPSPVYLGLADTKEARMAIYAEYVSANRVQDEMIKANQLPF